MGLKKQECKYKGIYSWQTSREGREKNEEKEGMHKN